MYSEYHLNQDALIYRSDSYRQDLEYKNHVASWKSKSDVYSDSLLLQYQRQFFLPSLTHLAGHFLR